MREKIDRLEQFVSQIKEAKNGSTSSSPADETAKATDAAAEDPAQEVVPLIGALRLSETGGTQYVGPGHWEAIIEDVRIVSPPIRPVLSLVDRRCQSILSNQRG
jgi:hypothetical protein